MAMKENEARIQCNICGSNSEKTRIVYGKNICESCLSTDYIWCDHCNGYHERNELLECEWCGSPICDEDIHRDCNDTVLCASCWGIAYTCDVCDIYVHPEDIYEHDGGVYCSSCSNGCKNIGRTKKVDYSYKPIPLFYGSGPVYFGIELEVDGSDLVNDDDECYSEDAEGCIDKILGDVNSLEWRVYAKDDSSLHEGFEIVSMPATLEYHLKHFPWKALMDTVLNYGFRSHDTQTCGLHIHISRVAFEGQYGEEYGIANLIYLFETFWDQIKCFSRRSDDQIRQWANRYGFQGNSSKLFYEAKLASQRSRYFAINLQNENTVEIRIFRGSLNYNTFAATLQFCQLLVDTANSLTTDQLESLTWQGLIIRGREYAELNTYLQERGLCALAS